MNEMISRTSREPNSMSALIDKMAEQQDLRGFALKLNEAVPEEDRGTHASLQTSKSMKSAMDGIAPPQGAAEKPVATPEGRKSGQGQAKGIEKEQ